MLQSDDYRVYLNRNCKGIIFLVIETLVLSPILQGAPVCTFSAVHHH